ncbi:MAG: class I SAM-dependent rRNA methyltransferase [Anaerolinea sp.]|nr:class I SAM-dependent rRNA methyltransferase [Anaerolinea sp.]
MTARIIIKADREKPIINQHPWVFSGAIAEVKGSPAPGDIVDVVSSKGKFLARGYWNAQSQIQVRILTWRDEPVDDTWWFNALQRAISVRPGGDSRADMKRLVNAENDYLPGLVVDRYGEWLVLQALTLGVDIRKARIAEMLRELVKPLGVYERSDVDVRRKEGLGEVTGVLSGDEPPALIEVDEFGRKLLIDVRKGHKTGYYLDQADNRRLFLDLVKRLSDEHARELDVLNLFSYTGSFSLHALPYGRAANIDASRDALELAEQITQANFPDRDDLAEYILADVFEYLRDTVDRHIQYDLVVLDPPKFAHNAQQVDKAARGYKDLNLNAFKVIAPGGYLLTFSCSGAITRDLFQKIVFGALADTGRQAQIVRHLSQAEDHPVALTFPEGEYLKGLLLRVW